MMESSVFVGKVSAFVFAAAGSVFVRGTPVRPTFQSNHQNVTITKVNTKGTVQKTIISSSLDPFSSRDLARGKPASFGEGSKGRVKAQKQIKTSRLSKIQKEILYGILLGDANLDTENGGRTYRLRVVQGEEHKAYLFHLYETFQELTGTEPKFNPANKTWYFNTLQDGCFRFYGTQFYKQVGQDRVKMIPRQISNWISLRTMAYWYCDDGSVKDKKTSPAFRLCTDKFEKQDVERLVKALQDRYQVNAKLFENRPNQYRIYIGAADPSKFSSKQTPLNIRDQEFGKQFLPYIIPEMRSKIPPKWML